MSERDGRRQSRSGAGGLSRYPMDRFVDGRYWHTLPITALRKGVSFTGGLLTRIGPTDRSSQTIC
jgi:hypothetical protein